MSDEIKKVLLMFAFSFGWTILHSIFIPFDMTFLVHLGISILGYAWAESFVEEMKAMGGDTDGE